MARRTTGGIAAASVLLGLVALAPMVANASSDAVVGPETPAAAGPTLESPDVPFDPQPLVLLLVAGSIGGMGVLAREPVSERARTRR